MKLIILRHGEAGYASLDHLRQLTANGSHKIQQVSQDLLDKYTIDLVYSSPFARAQETAQIIIDYAEQINKPINRIELTESLTPYGNVEQIVTLIQNTDLEYQTILLASHLPLVDMIAYYYLQQAKDKVYFNTGSYAVIEINPDNPTHSSLIECIT